MKPLSILILIALMQTLFGNEETNSQGESFLSQVDQVQTSVVDDGDMLGFFDRKREPLPHAMRNLPAGSSKPKGWLRELMAQDLQDGIVGALGELYPGIKADDLYRTARRGGMEDIPEMGDLVLTGEPWEKSIMWWNAETIGNWWDGYIRHAFMVEDEAAMARSRAIVNNLLASQGEDGYIGIYKENLRYQHTGSNGELWAQTTAFRTLLGFYEITGETRVLEAVENAMAVTMRHYSEDARNPFELENEFGGVTHGLMLTDVCDTLFRITGKEQYREYSVFLYKSYSRFSTNRAFNDLRYPFLLERDEPFTAHAVHTYEHLRSVLDAYYATGYPELEKAFDNAMHKLELCMLPSGAGHGNEWIAGLDADPDVTSTEFCAMLELRNFFTSAAQKTGDMSYADRAEKLTYNAMLGTRNEEGTAITYGKPDNCCVLDGHHHGDHEPSPDSRYKYSPTHSDPAVCCVPNYTRNFSYFLDSMWMKRGVGLAAVMYGPSTLATKVTGADVTIEQETNYPFSDEIVFTLKLSEARAFPLYFRVPQWAQTMDVDAKGAKQVREGEFLKVTKTWKSGERIRLRFGHEVERIPFQNGESYLQRGPLVFAYSIPHREDVQKTYKLDGFTDYYCYPEDRSCEILGMGDGQEKTFRFVPSKLGDDEAGSVLSSLPRLDGQLTDVEKEEAIDVSLVPMAGTVLRKVTF
ncbi:beta-L-arabinofuranosidase domain-containing protein [Pelagicoccus mobilis]|uniref:Glycoside hydrolase family 127 protein n=1 Tax=Pelagicoccus mobilis TaxID=415221 RepID=A0A934RY45_9BACT|nr:beta-L-arabinofuranosidase domain-containing protein [Pelagicoccus mobilis]MBK1878711.1 glycoside hydrolase family 127 protein [Pelagicoccus mobilis]